MSQNTPPSVMTGREAVEYFSKCHHLGKVQYMYFNKAPSRVSQPYNLVSVPKEKVSCSFSFLVLLSSSIDFCSS